MKDPCYQSDMVNVPTPSCTKGSPWVEERAFKTLIEGFYPLTDPQVTLVNNDNFHRASTVFPYHHPEMATDCDQISGPCFVNHISIT